MKTKPGPILFIFILLYLPVGAFAWGMLGHRITGEIAQSYLSSKAKKEIARILGNESVAMSSNWADFIKSDSNYNYLNTWHYVNIKPGLNYNQLKQLLESDTSVNVYTKLNFLIKELKTRNLDMDTKRMYLRLVIHFVGDMHQPLHTGRPEDRGGNRIKVLWFNNPSNLHRVWDEQLIEYQQLSYTEYTKAINFTTKEQVNKLQNQPMSEWFFESYELCTRLYDQITIADQPLSYNYNFMNVEALNAQLLKGGVRLAGILNNIFG